ncbi:MAG: cell division protein ZapA [Butyricicoccus sp.]|nr:cell division protein ZapA [Butyricicoccus sp.]
MANRLTVNIGGQVFHLVADESVEYMSMIARAADEKVTEACKMTGSSTFAAGVLAVLNIADDAVKAQEELKSLRERYAALEAGVLTTQEQLDKLTGEVEFLRAENEKLRKNGEKTPNNNQKRKKK